MDPSPSASYESEKLDPPAASKSKDNEDDYLASHNEQPGARAGVPNEPKPSTDSTSWTRRVRFNSDALKRIWSPSAGSETEEQQPKPPMTSRPSQTLPRTPTDHDKFSGSDHGFFYQQIEPSRSPNRGLTPEDEYLRSFGSVTKTSTGTNTVPEPHHQEAETQTDSGYLQIYSEAEELLRFHRLDFTTNATTSDQGQLAIS